MILQANGVRQYSGGEKGGPFDGGRQQVVSVVDTGDERLDNTVAEQVNIGFETADKIIRYETVTVYRFVDKV
jgi:molecular chaperone GrpE (heat shock protein)